MKPDFPIKGSIYFGQVFYQKIVNFMAKIQPKNEFF